MLRALTFGQCAFETPVARIGPDSEIHFALLLSIVAGPPTGVTRDELVARIWPRSEPDDARHCLRQAMYRLRRLSVPIRLQSGSVVLSWTSTDSDLHTLLHGALRRDDLVRLGGMPFLPSYVPMLGDVFGDWIESLRARVATRLRHALAEEVTATRSRGRFHEMGQVARALLALGPLNEVGTMGLAEALALEGSKVEALRLLEEYEEEVGAINTHLQLPVRVLRQRVAEVLDGSWVLPRAEEAHRGRQPLRPEAGGGLRSSRGSDDITHAAAQPVFRGVYGFAVNALPRSPLSRDDPQADAGHLVRRSKVHSTSQGIRSVINCRDSDGALLRGGS